MSFPRATEIAHQWMGERLQQGDHAIDATAGNGHDTCFLAWKVGNQGRVWALDVQEEAIASTRQRLHDAGLLPRVSLLHDSHAALTGGLAEEIGTVRGVMFNLGYLPGGDTSIITEPGSTLPALRASCDLLDDGGLMTVIVYPGHPGGAEEADAVDDFCSSLCDREFRVVRYQRLNASRPAPYLIGVERIA